MKKRPAIFVASIFLSALFFNGVSTLAATGSPKIISYQGRLADTSSNQNLIGGAGTTFFFRFSIWDSPTVNAGARLWPSTAPGTATTTVKQGVFNVNIGDTASGYPDALTYDFFSTSTVYLQVEVSSNGTSFETLSPRQQITSSGFSLNSNTVAGLVPGWTQNTGFVSLASSTDLVGIGATSSLAKFFVQSNSVSTITALLQGTAGQTADLFRVASSSGVVFFQISNLGIASSSEFRSPSSTIDALTFTNASGTNLTASGYGLFPTLNFTNSSGTNIGLTGYLYANNVSSSNVSSTNQTIAGYLNVSATSSLQGLTFTNTSGTNISASGYLQGPTLNISGQSTQTSVSSTNIGATGYGYFLGNVGVGTAAPTGIFQVSSSIIYASSTSGNVGIGTASPGFLLDVAGDVHISKANGQPRLLFRNNANTADITIISKDGATDSIQIGSVNTTDLELFASGAEVMRLKSSGNVGIGTSTVSQLFTIGTSTNAFTVDVSGNVSSSANLSVSGYGKFPTLSFTNASGTNLGLTGYLYASNASTSNVSSTNHDNSGYLTVIGKTTFTNASGTNTGLTGYLYAVNASTSNVSSTNIGNTGYHYNLGNLGVGTTTTSNLLFIGTSSPIFVVSSTGNVGIGTSTPATALVIGSGQVSIPAGTQGAPSLAFSSDLTSGIFAGANNVIDFSTAGSQRMRITTSNLFLQGSFGIQCNTDNNCDLGGTSNRIRNIYVGSNLFVGTTTASGLFTVGTSTTLFVVSSTGNVGIGTTAPSTTLDIAGGTAGTLSEGIRIERSINNGFFTVINNNGGGTRLIAVRTDQVNPKLGITFESAGSDLVPATRMAIDTNGNVVVGSSTASQLFTIASSTNAFTIDSSGNVSSSANMTVKGYVADNQGNRYSTSTGPIAVQVFTANGTYTPTAGAKVAIVEVVGGGGGGGGSSASSGPGAGGGGGGYARKRIASPTSQTCTVGAGGTGGAADTVGGVGGTTSFGALMQATGGSGGGNNSGLGGVGGIGSSGDLNVQGGDGGPPLTAAINLANPGGSSVLGGGGRGNAAGRVYGGGAGGASGTSVAGQAGAAGVCIITEY